MPPQTLKEAKALPLWRKLWRFSYPLFSVFALSIFALGFWPDSPPPDDAGMTPTWTDVRDENPLATFQQWLNDHPLNTKPAEEIISLLKNEKWEPEMAASILNQYPDLMVKYDQLVAGLDEPWRWLEKDAVASRATNIDLNALNVTANIIELKIISLAEAGSADQAIEQAVKLMRVGHKLSEAQGTTLHWLAANTVWQKGLDNLVRILPKSDLNIEQLSKLQAELAKLRPDIETLKFACRVEYLAFSMLMKDLKAGNTHKYVDLEEVSGMPLMVFFQVNRSKEKYLNLVQPVLGELDGPWPQLDEKLKIYNEQIKDKRLIKTFVHPNAFGNMLMHITLPALYGSIERHYNQLAKHQCALIALQLRKHQLEHGRMPDELIADDNLKSLDDVFTGQPLKWNKESGVIYSVGADMKDDGGVLEIRTERHRIKRPDVGVRYFWQPSTEGK